MIEINWNFVSISILYLSQLANSSWILSEKYTLLDFSNFIFSDPGSSSERSNSRFKIFSSLSFQTLALSSPEDKISIFLIIGYLFRRTAM